MRAKTNLQCFAETFNEVFLHEIHALTHFFIFDFFFPARGCCGGAVDCPGT
jgi:hypothetical protein